MIIRGVATEPKRLPQELLGVFLFFFGIIVLLSLATFDADDRHLNHVVNVVAPVRNSAGIFGAYLAGLLVDFFGLSSYFVPAVLVYSGGRKILGRQPGEARRKVSSLIFWLCFASLSYSLDIGAGGVRGGGLLGISVGRFAIQFFSPVGATLVWIFFMLFAAQLHFNFSWFALISLSVVNFWNKVCASCHNALDSLKKTLIRKSRHTQPPEVKDTVPPAGHAGNMFRQPYNDRQTGDSQDSHVDRPERLSSGQAKNVWVNANALIGEVGGANPDWAAKSSLPEAGESVDVENSESTSEPAAVSTVGADTVCAAAIPIKSIIERPQNIQPLQPQTPGLIQLTQPVQPVHGVTDAASPQPASLADGMRHVEQKELLVTPGQQPFNTELAAQAPQTAGATRAAAEISLRHESEQRPVTDRKNEQKSGQMNAQALQSSSPAQGPLQSSGLASSRKVPEEDHEMSWLDGPSPLQERLEIMKKKYGADQPVVQSTAPLPVEPLFEPDPAPVPNSAGEQIKEQIKERAAQQPVPTLISEQAGQNTTTQDHGYGHNYEPAPEITEPYGGQNIPGSEERAAGEQYPDTPESKTYTVGMERQPLLDSVPGAAHEPAVIKAALDPRLCKLPGLDLLEANSGVGEGPSDEVLDEKARSLMACLSDFGIQGELTRIVPGPVVTMFEVKPAPGVRVARIASLNDDLALALKAIAVRVQAPIPGSDTVGIEIPNEQRETVSFRDILDSKPFNDSESFLTMALGKDIAGNPVAADLAKMPHLLVAGATGAGKSVCLNSILLSLLYKAKPHELQLLLIDPKRIEMAVYADLPHLVHPVVTEMPLAKNALEWAVAEMDRRYTEIARLGVRNILGYNNKLSEMGPDRPAEFVNTEPMPYLVIIIDELADLMLTAAKDVETSIVRLAQLARAAGIHLILATQRPSVDVVTGLIKANFPCRISFQVTSKHDSRTILDTVGAEHLLGKGDMLFKPGGGKFQRLHGAFVSDGEVARVADFWRDQMPPAYKVDFTSWGELSGPGNGNGSDLIDNVASDPMYAEAVDFVTQQGKASISLIQRRFRIGFNRAARYVEQMEHDGLIGPADGSKPRLLIR